MQAKRKPDWMKKIFDSYGGKDTFFAFFAAVMAQMKAGSRPPTDDIDNVSRVLHAHFMAERFLTRYLQCKHPRSKSLHNAGHSFSQKVDLIDPEDFSVSFLVTGLRRLDLIRNRLAGAPSIAVSGLDKKALLAVPLFGEFRNKAACKQNRRNQDAVSVMECFATFAGIILHNEADPDKKRLLSAKNSKRPPLKRRKK
jgi:hypothetical protein